MSEVRQLVAQAELIIIARCSGRLDPDGVGGEPVRRLAYDIERALFGDATASSIYVVIPARDASDDPPAMLYADGRYVLFLGRGELSTRFAATAAVPPELFYELVNAHDALMLAGHRKGEFLNDALAKETGIDPITQPELYLDALELLIGTLRGTRQDRPDAKLLEGPLGPWLRRQLQDAP